VAHEWDQLSRKSLDSTAAIRWWCGRAQDGTHDLAIGDGTHDEAADRVSQKIREEGASWLEVCIGVSGKAKTHQHAELREE
jgi:hypothetical protein